MNKQKKVSEYFKLFDAVSTKDVAIGQTMFKFHKSAHQTFKEETMVTVITGSSTKDIYIGNMDQFEEFVKYNCNIEEINAIVPKFIPQAEMHTLTLLQPKVVVAKKQNLRTTKKETAKVDAKTEAESLLESSKDNILKAVKDFFNEPNKTVNLTELIKEAPKFIFERINADGSKLTIERSGGITTLAVINGNLVPAVSTVNLYTDVEKGLGFSLSFIYRFQDKRFQDLFFKQSLKSMSIGLSLGFNFSAIMPKLPNVSNVVAEGGKATTGGSNTSDFKMDLNFAQQKFKQQLKLRKDFFTKLEPVMIISTNLVTGAIILLDVADEIKKLNQLEKEAEKNEN